MFFVYLMIGFIIFLPYMMLHYVVKKHEDKINDVQWRIESLENKRDNK